MKEFHRSVHHLRTILADMLKRFNVTQISSLKDTLPRCKYLYILLVYTCIIMQFIFISTLYYLWLNTSWCWSSLIPWFQVISEQQHIHEQVIGVTVYMLWCLSDKRDWFQSCLWSTTVHFPSCLLFNYSDDNRVFLMACV